MVFELAPLYQATGVVGFAFFLFTAVTARGAHGGGHAHGIHAHGGGHGIGHGVGGGHAIGGGHGVAGGHAIGGGHGVAGGHAIGGGHGVAGGHAIGGGHGAGSGHAIGGGHGAPASGHALGGGRIAPAGGHAAGAGQGAAGGHAAGAHAGSAGQGGSGQGTSGQSNSSALVQGTTGQSVTGPMHVPHEIHHFSPVELFLSVFNPMRMASFFLFFGAGGRLSQLACPWLGYFTVPIAIACGVIGSTLVLMMFSFIYTRFQSSTMLIMEDVIGRMAEISVPIPPGRTGEVTYIYQSKRFTSAAKAVSAAVGFSRGDKVMIANVDNSITYVEPWTESFMDPSYDADFTPRDGASESPA